MVDPAKSPFLSNLLMTSSLLSTPSTWRSEGQKHRGWQHLVSRLRAPWTGKKHGRFPKNDPWVSLFVVTEKVWGWCFVFSFHICFCFFPIRTSCCQFFLVHSFHVFLSSLAKTLRSQPAEGWALDMWVTTWAKHHEKLKRSVGFYGNTQDFLCYHSVLFHIFLHSQRQHHHQQKDAHSLNWATFIFYILHLNVSAVLGGVMPLLFTKISGWPTGGLVVRR